MSRAGWVSGKGQNDKAGHMTHHVASTMLTHRHRHIHRQHTHTHTLIIMIMIMIMMIINTIVSRNVQGKHRVCRKIILSRQQHKLCHSPSGCELWNVCWGTDRGPGIKSKLVTNGPPRFRAYMAHYILIPYFLIILLIRHYLMAWLLTNL